MGSPPAPQNVLVVEGKDDLYSVVGLLRAYIDWPEAPSDAPVYIRVGDGKDVILEDGYLSTVLKQSGLRAVGIMLDADSNCGSCYERVRNRCSDVFPDLPKDIPESGLIMENQEHLRLGVWIMPDNTSSGDLETFLRHLVPPEMDPLWAHAVGCTEAARDLGATYQEAQRAKADIHTFLAWQDPPGQPLGLALTARTLDPISPRAEPFVRWFRELFAV